MRARLSCGLVAARGWLGARLLLRSLACAGLASRRDLGKPFGCRGAERVVCCRWLPGNFLRDSRFLRCRVRLGASACGLSVVLPQPDSPTMPRVSPRSRSKLTLLTAMARCVACGECASAYGIGFAQIAHGQDRRSSWRLRAFRSTKTHLALCAEFTRRRSGTRSSHSGRRNSQRGAKAQPGGNALRDGTVPGIGVSLPRSSLGAALRQAGRIRMTGIAEDFSHRAFFDDAACVHYCHARGYLRYYA